MIQIGNEMCVSTKSESKRCADIRLLWFMVKASTRVREYDSSPQPLLMKYAAAVINSTE